MKKFWLGMALMTAAGSASAVGVGVRAGTTGIGADVAVGIAPMVAARVGFSSFNYTRSVNDSDFKYDGKLQLKNTSLLLDFSPPAVPIRLSAGLVSTGNKVDVTGTPNNGTYTLNGQQYSAAQIGSINGQVKGERRHRAVSGYRLGQCVGPRGQFLRRPGGDVHGRRQGIAGRAVYCHRGTVVRQSGFPEQRCGRTAEAAGRCQRHSSTGRWPISV
jgi:hypothetical protein